MKFLSCFILFMMSLLTIAFITVLERKFLGLSQVRLGPNKVLFLGIGQPVLDGMKLLSKQSLAPVFSQQFAFFLLPTSMLFILYVFWSIMLPWTGNILSLKFSVLMFFLLLGMLSYAIILVGWSSNSGYAKLGSMRSILQGLSYEIVSVILLLSPMLLLGSLSFVLKGNLNFFLMSIWWWVWNMTALMESNRAPFDLVEGESELISGFNIEVGHLGFTFLFISEYGMLLAMAGFSSFGATNTLSWLVFVSISLFLFTRSCFPRVRYDHMMAFMWYNVLPMSLFFLMSTLFLKL